ncbi:MAG: PKD domain-containing protein [Candidatus Bathyarchaeia archaeon]
MGKKLGIAHMVVIMVFALITVLPVQRGAGALQTSGVLRIYGLVNRPLNLTYDELFSFPMVSEVAELKCVDGFPDVTGNWTGIPLFYLLTLAQINSDAYKVVTYGSDGFSSDLLVEDALRPTTILALEDNGTTSASAIEPLPRLIVPNNWGYKWVAEVDAIEVVNYDYKGTWESSGYSDNGTRPGSTALPSITPPLQELNFAFGNLTFNVEAFTDVSISSYMLDHSQKQLSLNVTVPSGIGGFADFILPQDFLKSPYSVTLDNQAVDVIEADLSNQSYLYASIPEGFNAVKIVGAGVFGFAPEIEVSASQIVNVGETVIFDASKSAAYGTIVSYEWSFGDGTNGTGAVVSHSYNKLGTYQAELNVTDNNGLSSSETLTITVENPPEYIPLAVKVLLAAVLGLLILMFAVLVRGRRKERVPKQ